MLRNENSSSEKGLIVGTHLCISQHCLDLVLTYNIIETLNMISKEVGEFALYITNWFVTASVAVTT
jgi:hypothetical protein